MTDPTRSGDLPIPESFFKTVEFSGGAPHKETVVGGNRQSGGVVAAVFKTAQAVHQQRNRCFRTDVSYNPAHRELTLKFQMNGWRPANPGSNGVVR
jgi:hypothetical protein